MIYRFLKVVLKIAFFLFYKKMVITGQEKLPTKGPLLVAGNHPNTLMDPLIVAVITRQQVGFLGNASIFFNKLASAVLRYFHVIPVYRKQDVKPGEKQDNSAAFAASHEYLKNEGTILVFPEGTSHYELKLREIKKGTATIALSYEKSQDYSGGLQISTVSLDYSDSLRFRSVVSVNVNDPIHVADFKEVYEKDEKQGIVALTERIRDNLAAPIPHTSDKAQERFLLQAHRFYTTYREPTKNLFVNAQESLALRSLLSRSLQDLQQRKSKMYDRLQEQLLHFYALLDDYRLTLGFFTDDFQEKGIFWRYAGYLLLFVLLLPFYLLGLAANYLPFVLPGIIFRKMKIDIEYKTSVSLVGGLVFFPLFYAGYIWLFHAYVSIDWLAMVSFALFLPVSGFIAMFYWRNVKRFVRLVRYSFRLSAEQKQHIVALRDAILNDIHAAQQITGISGN